MSKHDATLNAVFAHPTRANVKWADVLALLKNRGAEVTEGSGSRVRVALNGVRAVFHKPHPQPQLKKKQLEAVRDFLVQAGVTP